MVSTARSIIDLDGAPWVDAADKVYTDAPSDWYWEIKVLHAPDGHRVQVTRANGDAPPHVHTKASSGFVFAGALALPGHTCTAGTWYLEPYGAIHPRTTFRDLVFGFGMREGGFGTPSNVLLDSVEELPDWVRAMGARRDDLSNAVEAERVPWQPVGEGLAMRLLHAFERSAWFVSMLKAEAGAVLPRRRYIGPCDFYVMSGRAELGDDVAERGWWIHEAAGTDEDVVRFPVETVLLVNTYGTVLEYDGAGGLSRIIDGYSLRAG